MLRIIFPYILFISLVALSAGVLNTWSRFALPAFTPVLLNLCFIGMALFAAPCFDPPVMALAWGVFLGGVAATGAAAAGSWRRSACCRARAWGAARRGAADPRR